MSSLHRCTQEHNYCPSLYMRTLTQKLRTSTKIESNCAGNSPWMQARWLQNLHSVCDQHSLWWTHSYDAHCSFYRVLSSVLGHLLPEELGLWPSQESSPVCLCKWLSHLQAISEGTSVSFDIKVNMGWNPHSSGRWLCSYHLFDYLKSSEL